MITNTFWASGLVRLGAWPGAIIRGKDMATAIWQLNIDRGIKYLLLAIEAAGPDTTLVNLARMTGYQKRQVYRLKAELINLNLIDSDLNINWSAIDDGDKMSPSTRVKVGHNVTMRQNVTPNQKSKGDKMSPSTRVKVGHNVTSAESGPYIYIDPNNKLPEETELRTDQDLGTVKGSKEDVELSSGENGRAPSSYQEAVGHLELVFTEASGIPAPKPSSERQRKSAGVRWWSVLGRFYDLAGRDVEVAARLVKSSVKRYRREGITISAPQSIEKEFISQLGSYNTTKGRLSRKSGAF